MKFTNVLEVTKKAIAQTLGDTYMSELGELSALSSEKLVDVGKDVLDSGSVDTYVKTLLVQLGSIYIESREYVSELKSMYVDSFEWGGFVERVYTGLNSHIMDDPMWNTVNGTSYADIEHTFYQPDVQAKIFEEGKSIMIPISKQTEVLKQAFKSWEEMTRFLSAIDMSVRNTLKVAMDSYAHMLLACGIAVSDKALNNSVHLLTEAKAKGIVEADVTSEEALENEAYLVYCLRRMRNTEKYMKRMTSAFNNGNLPMQAIDVNKVLLTDFVSSTKFNVRANTYNLDEIGIGAYDEVSAWQGVTDGTDAFGYDSNSKIMLSADATNKLGVGTSAVTLENAIGVIFDKMAMGLSLDRVKVTTSYTASTDMNNFFTHALVNYLLDSNYSMVAFFND